MVTEACCTPAPPAAPTQVGKEEVLAGTKVYITGSASASAAVIMINDVFGFDAPLLRKLADKVAVEGGYFVVVPDVLKGDPFTGSFAAGDFGPWIAKHGAKDEALEMTRGVVEAVKDKGFGAVGCAGFCWGAKVAVCLGKEKDVRAVVQLHPSFVEKSDYEEVVVPIAVLAAPTDGVEQYEELLASRTEVKSFVKVFSDVRHGWTVRYEENDENDVEKANEAHKLMLDWFAKYL
ncbi:hypothetical protein M758_10G155600 [Ceratodon purpureus]|uniref:Dienelactone hydrolase domain-containing protein n=1 Tax=Ceratodon purpureus TaxID=3225 RepID=A0A8T0GKU3_CERPU|nr:hypothetical protein KC19_10G159800 [Ceratodon purpureus]KAG0604236.1 hypothetical protein M758_10G155600 [Ceratodon purpureus]